MARHTFKLKDGLKLQQGDSEIQQLDVTIREPTAGEVIDGKKEAERVVMTEHGPVLVVSPSELSRTMIRKQVVSIGSIPGPLSEELFNKLSSTDLVIIDREIAKLDAAALKEVERRGRADPKG